MRVRSLIVRVGAALASLILLPSAGLTQTAPDPPPGIAPVKSVQEINGINLTSGKKDVDMPVVLSAPGDPRLKFDKVQNAAPYITGISAPNGDSFSWSYTTYVGGGTSESFKCPEGDCVSTTGSGSRLPTMGSYTRAPGGEEYRFTLVHADEINGTQHFRQKYASSVAYPDGEVISYTYDTGSVIGLSRTFYRPIQLTSTTGYYITISYLYAGTDASVANWAIPGEAKLYAPGGTLIRRVTYGSNYTTVTDYGAGDPTGRVYQATGANVSLGGTVESSGATLQLPTEGSNSLTISQLSGYGVVGSVNRDGVAWNYSYANIGFNPRGDGYNYSNVTVTGPNAYSMSYAMFQGPIAEAYANHVGSQTDALGKTTTYGYDSAHGNRLTDITLPEGNHVNVVYDECANIITKTTTAKPGSGLANIVESAVYPSTGLPENPCPSVTYYRPTSTTDALGRVTNYTWNTLGQLTQQLDPADNAGVRRETDITYTVSAGGHSRKTLVRVCGQTTTCSGNAEGHTEYTYFGETNLPATVTVKDEATSATRTTTYGYDVAGRPLSIDGPLAGTDDAKYFRYDVYGRKTWEIGAADANGVRPAKRITYRDSDDKPTKVESGTIPDPNNTNLTILETTDLTYDSRRYAIRELTSSGGTAYKITDKSFLDRGLADCTTVRMNFAAAPFPTATSACTLGTTGSSGPDRITKNTYDNAGQLTKVQKAYGVTTANGFPQTLQADYVTYTYTNNGKQLTVTDANGNKAQYTYDGHDRLTKWAFPDKVTVGAVSTTDYEQYGYDAAGNRTSLRKRDGSTLTYTFDNLNRVITKVVPSRADLTAAQVRDVYTTYDRINRPLAIKFDSFTGADGITNTFDGFGDQTSSQISVAGFTKSIISSQADYDAAGRRLRVTHPDGQVFSYDYDARDRLKGLYEGATVTSTAALDVFAYNPDGTLLSRTEGSANQPTAGYTWDGIGRLTSQTDAFPLYTGSNVNWTFTINQASQLTSEARNNDSYAYGGLVGVNRNYSVNGLNQYTAAGPASFTYDTNGNLLTDGTNAYIYDIENRLVSATAAGQTTTLTYDPLGRLFQVVKGSANTRFAYDGDAMVGEYDSSGNITNRYVHGPNARADDPFVWYVGGGLTTKRYLHADHLGSIVAVTNCTAGAPCLNKYDDYGIPQTDGSGNNVNNGRFQYTGQAFIPELGAGMYYYKARMYSAFLGRFLQTDPIGYKDQINLYAYVANDPIDTNDPSGMCCADNMDPKKDPVTGPTVALFTGSRLPSASPPAGLASSPVAPPHSRSQTSGRAEQTSKGAATVGGAAAGARVASRNEGLGSNGKIYDARRFHGNGSVTVTKPSPTYEAAGRLGRGTVYLGAAADTVQAVNGDMSPIHYGLNRAVDAGILGGGPIGEILGAIYYVAPVLGDAAQNADSIVNVPCDSCVEPEL